MAHLFFKKNVAHLWATVDFGEMVHKEGWLLKNKNMYPSCKIFEGVCSCKDNFNSKTECNATIHWDEHNYLMHDSGPQKSLKKQFGLKFYYVNNCEKIVLK